MLILLLYCIIAVVSELIPEIKNGLVASSLKFANVDGKPTKLIFGDAKDNIQFVHYPDVGLQIQSSNKPLIGVYPQNITIYTPLYSNEFLNIQGKFLVNNVPQWLLVHREDFSTGLAIGYDNTNPNLITICANIYMLGGYGKFSKGEISKELSNLPPHTKLRIQATYHFIDNWAGETGFMRVNTSKDGSLVYVWTDSHNQADDSQSVNVCGSGVGEGKFAVPIDISFPHNSSNLIFAFGSTIEFDDPNVLSWGISQFELYAM